MDLHQVSPFVLNSQSVGDYKLSLAKPDMAFEIADMVNEGFIKEVTRKEGSLRYPDSNEILTEIEKTDKVGWIILQDPNEDNKIIGSLELVEELEKHTINAFTIDKDYRGEGLGARLLAVAESMLKTKKVSKLYLDVISVAKEELLEVEEWLVVESKLQAEKDTLANFYINQGFEFTGVSKLTPISWQRESRKEKYVGRVYLREMCKSLI